MCIALPLKITELLSPHQAVCDDAGGPLSVDISLLEGLCVGDWVSVHRGTAVARMTDADARRILDALSALDRVRAGDTEVDHLFADLVNREPPRPPQA